MIPEIADKRTFYAQLCIWVSNLRKLASFPGKSYPSTGKKKMDAFREKCTWMAA
jgi:hypothetical protein